MSRVAHQLRACSTASAMALSAAAFADACVMFFARVDKGIFIQKAEAV